MGSPRRKRLALAVAGFLVLVLLALLWRVARRGDDAQGPPRAAGLTGGGGALRPATPPPVARTNEQGQPLDENGRPIGPGRVVRYQKRLAPGEMPIIPPYFEDEQDRAEYRRWWIEEFARRAEIYKRLVPRAEGYPTADATARLLAEFYDAAEPRRPDETAAAAAQRRRQWRERFQEFIDTYGAPPKTINSRGGDPQYGAPTPPPVDPPNVEEKAPPPAMPESPPPPGWKADER